MLPVLARAFAELGYRRATTAELARRCGVRENVLYRLWPDKRAMFIAAIGHVYDASRRIWSELLAGPGGGTAAVRLLAYESRHHGEFGLYRILFAGLGETDDAEIREALGRTFARFQGYLRDRIADHRDAGGDEADPDADQRAWAVVGLGTLANIGVELGLLTPRARRDLLAGVGRLLLEGRAASARTPRSAAPAGGSTRRKRGPREAGAH
jgi:AcrR family transcriptional regulator